MKRANLVLDEALLEEARQILTLAQTGLWEGDLSVVREDRGVYRTKRRGSR